MTLFSSDKKLSSEFVLTLLFFSFLAFRISVNIGNLDMDNMDTVFRVGLIPWSDAKGWSEGAIQILSGEPISGMATARPLYSLFLSVLFILTDSTSYAGAIYGQMIVSALVLTAAYHLLKPIPDRIAVLLFMSFLIVWRPEVSTVFLTENLGMYILILSFVTFWRGFHLGCHKTELAGAFLLGLSQAVRPWCVMSLVTVPFICFVSKKPIRKKIKSFVLLVVLISIGFGFHTTAAVFFNKPGERYTNIPHTLYGQVAGGKGWASVYKDPVIKKALEERQAAEEVNRIMYQRIKTLLFKNPYNFLNASVKGYRYYFVNIPIEFGNNWKTPIFFLLFFLTLYFLQGIRKQSLLFRNLYRSPWISVLTISGILLFFF